jgi:lysophospholipase L1-like esterase
MPCTTGGANDYGWTGQFDCHWYTSNQDGPSHQSALTQNTSLTTSTCGGPPWIISTDTGIHPNVAGYTQFASALENLVTTQNVVPPLPNPPPAG